MMARQTFFIKKNVFAYFCGSLLKIHLTIPSGVDILSYIAIFVNFPRCHSKFVISESVKNDLTTVFFTK
jgi:hypothetical protein